MLATGTWGREFRCRGPCSQLRPPCSGRRRCPRFRKIATQLNKFVRNFNSRQFGCFSPRRLCPPSPQCCFWRNLEKFKKSFGLSHQLYIPTLSKRRTRPSSARWPKSTLRRGNQVSFFSIFLHFSITSPRIKLAQGLRRGALLAPSLFFKKWTFVFFPYISAKKAHHFRYE